ncbi:MAG: SoxR reducing system RseC family protein [Treponema sp.]|nr:SoxR reducing system RseC family protein [Treponema sp.]
MIERGRVRSVSGTSVTIRQEMGAVCFGCMNAECKKGKGLITAENSAGLELSPGQLVETSVSRPSLALQALTALCPPLAGYGGTFVLTGLFFPSLGEPARAALGVAALAAVGFACFRLCRRFQGRAAVTVVRVVGE